MQYLIIESPAPRKVTEIEHSVCGGTVLWHIISHGNVVSFTKLAACTSFQTFFFTKEWPYFLRFVSIFNKQKWMSTTIRSFLGRCQVYIGHSKDILCRWSAAKFSTIPNHIDTWIFSRHICRSEETLQRFLVWWSLQITSLSRFDTLVSVFLEEKVVY